VFSVIAGHQVPLSAALLRQIDPADAQ